MYEDRLFDTIIEEMMATFGADVRTDEGSLAYNACAKIAEKLEEVYGDMDELNDNMLPDTQDDSHLIEYGAERGIEYRYATAPIVKAVFSQEIEIGERFSCNDYTYEVTELIDGYAYKMTCETEGVEANTNTGALEPIDYVEDWQDGKITEVLIPGEDDEDIEVFRTKVIETFRTTSFAGNKADYRRMVNAINGVGGCKPKRRDTNSEWINIYIIDSSYNTASESLIEQVQTVIDPEQNHGEGDGMAPICHKVLIKSAEPVQVKISARVTFDDGYSAETSGNQIRESIEVYFLNLRKNWEKNEMAEQYVRLSQIEARILAVEGVLDVTGTTLNEDDGNVVLNYSQIPVLGGVNIV